MGFFRNIVNGIYKFAFGIDLNKQQKYINTLEKQIKKLKSENKNLKKEVESQKVLLNECNENLKRILSVLNKLITFKIYFGVDSNSKHNSTTNFEFTFIGIVPKHYDSKDIALQFNNHNQIIQLLHKFNISWLDYNSISDINKGGYDDRLVETEVSEYFEVGLTIDNNNLTYPNQKVNNDWRI